MNLSQQPRRLTGPDSPLAAFERRRKAAWLDYLRTTQVSDSAGYEQAESNAWEQLQRRLRRNDELLAASVR